MHPKDADGMANRVDPDQTTPIGAGRSESALFGPNYLSQYLQLSWYEKLYVRMLILMIILRYFRFVVYGKLLYQHFVPVLFSFV